MIQENNMDNIAKRIVDNVIKNTVEKVKNEKASEKKLHSLSQAINENDNSSKKMKSLHKNFFLSPSKRPSIPYFTRLKKPSNLLNNVQKSVYEKGKVFYKLYNEIKNRDTIFDEEDEKIAFRSPFIEQKKDMDGSLTLYSIEAPFELFHAVIDNI